MITEYIGGAKYTIEKTENSEDGVQEYMVSMDGNTPRPMWCACDPVEYIKHIQETYKRERWLQDTKTSQSE